MNYVSTRDTSKDKLSYTSAEAIKLGLAFDGGLFIPCEIPAISLNDIGALKDLSYTDRAKKILSLFLTDYTDEELEQCCSEAYCDDSFKGGAAPIYKINDSLYSLELWHGPTCAFKDMALQIMPKLLSKALVKTNETRKTLILVATSGDTGKAALEGYKNIEGINIMVFYPNDGVSTVQKLQMASQTGNNVNVCAIHGNFDDAQNGVKSIFSDKAFKEVINDENGVILSSANSINWGRLVPQIVYYFSAYCDLLGNDAISLGDKVNFCVPTGNFGNIFAAYIAKLMGLPINKLICASNSNNVLTDFFKTGEYNKKREFHSTISPSMDILISSNLERLLSFICGSEKTQSYMTMLANEGSYKVDAEDMEKINASFVGLWANESDTASTIKNVWTKYGYLIDTHTAVAVKCAEEYRRDFTDNTVTVAVSTASPYKFAADVYASIYGKKPESDVAALALLSEKTEVEIPYPLADIEKREIRFKRSIDPANMKNEVSDYIKSL